MSSPENDAERHYEAQVQAEYEAATGHVFDDVDAEAVADGDVCKEYDPAGEGAGVGREGEPVCAACGFDKSEHSEPEAPAAVEPTRFEDRVSMHGLGELIRPDNVCALFQIERTEYAGPDGRIMARYVFGFINQQAEIIGHEGPNGEMRPATLVFSNDTGRRSIATARRPRPGDIRLIGPNGGVR